MNRSQQKPSRDAKPKPAYSQNKKAFDAIVKHYIRMDRPLNGPPGAMNMEKSSGSATSRNPIEPSPVEFQCDVLLAVKAAMPKGVRLSNFILAYFLWDSEDDIERSLHAMKVLGGRMHSVEQRVGAEFVRRAIWPESGYFHPQRVTPRRAAV